ncbi:sarcosine oxidase subunit gamma [Ostreibacterium oceani]|nr:sarcosine oxidase subunit gamma family protein [Ostreibacterium oceani]
MVNLLDKAISAMRPVLTPYQGKATTGNAAENTAENTAVILTELACLDYLNVRIRATDEQARHQAAKVLGAELPSISQFCSNSGNTLLGIGPSEWLVVLPSGEAAKVQNELVAALGDAHHLVVDVTGGTTQLRVTGEKARAVLEKGAYVDLHPRIFKSGQHYATVLSGAPTVIMCYGDNDYALLVRRSFSDHVARWAIDAASEYGFTVTAPALKSTAE